MKSVLMSINPKWVAMILNGKKTVEVRKTAPKLETPFKCYIYRTTEKVDEIVEEYDINFKLLRRKKTLKKFSGKVIGEFVCDRIDRIGKLGINYNFDYCYLSLNEWGNDDIEIEITDIQKSCISKSELNAYGANSYCLYAWHISDLKIYDKPKELEEFRYACREDRRCNLCKYNTVASWDKTMTACGAFITRPPQSWCYVEEI